MSVSADGTRRRVPWADARVRAIVWQGTAVLAVAVTLAALAIQVTENLRLRGIASGFDYLWRTAGFEIAEGPLPYSSRDSYARALLAGLVNTIRVSLLGIVISTVLGVAIALARLSRIWMASALASAYVEVFRNTPLLLQLFFWYALCQALPAPHDALRPLPGVYLCFRGLFLPALVREAGRLTLESPELVGFGFRGGTSISPEFATLLIGLSTFTAAFIGEIVRGGILAINSGQTEAALALGLSRARTLRLVVLPQALPAMIPPTTTQFLNLAKNSSLAIAIGYPDLISVSNTAVNQTGQAIEVLALAMTVYLAMSLAISLAMSRYSRAVEARGRTGSPRAGDFTFPPAEPPDLDCRITVSHLDPRRPEP